MVPQHLITSNRQSVNYVTFENEYSDEYILGQLPTNDGVAMELLFKKYYVFLCQAVARILIDEHSAEDIVQEVLFEVWKKRFDLNINISLKAYLRRAAVNKTLNHIRDRKMRWDDEDKLASIPNNSNNIAVEMEGRDLEKAIHSAIDQLPERCRVVFSLSRFEEMSYQQIADSLGISIKTVENQMTKALRLLKESVTLFLANN